MTNQEKLKVIVEKYKDDLIGFAKKILKFSGEDYQEKTFEAVIKNNRVSIKSGQGVGKTATISCIVLWYIFTRKDAKVIVTSPSMTQLYNVLFKELGKWMDGSLLQYLFTKTKTTIYLNESPDTTFVLAKTSTAPENMAGFHTDNMLFVVDEASGVSDAILEKILGTTTHKDNKIIFISNPTKTDGIFYDTFNVLKNFWHNITINAEDSKRVSQENIKSLLKKYGSKEHAGYKVSVLGEFPEGNENSIIPRKLIENSINKIINQKFKDTIIYGLDVAKGSGGDYTVIYKDDGYSPNIFFKGNMTTMAQVSNKLINDIDKNKDKRVILMIDADGIGATVFDSISEMVYEMDIDNVEIYECHNGSPVTFEPKYYHNQIAEMFYFLKELLEDGLIKIDDNNELIEELSTREIAFSSNGKISVENKERLKKRIGRSPDDSDSFLLCVYGRKYL